MTAVLQLVPPTGADQADPRDPEVFRGGLASARAALRDGVTRRYREGQRVAVADHDGAEAGEP